DAPGDDDLAARDARVQPGDGVSDAEAAACAEERALLARREGLAADGGALQRRDANDPLRRQRHVGVELEAAVLRGRARDAIRVGPDVRARDRASVPEHAADDAGD